MHIFNTNSTVLFSSETGENWGQYSTNTLDGWNYINLAAFGKKSRHALSTASCCKRYASQNFCRLTRNAQYQAGVTYNIHWSTNFPGIYTIIFTIIVFYYLRWFQIVFKCMFTWPVITHAVLTRMDARWAYTCNHTTTAAFSHTC